MVRTAGRYLRRMLVRLMHSTSGVCLRMLLGIKWYQSVWNDDVWRLTKQPKLTAIIQSRRLTLFGHIMRMDDNADAKRILFYLPSSRLEKTTRSSQHHVAQHRPTGSETPPPYAPRSSRFGSEPPSVEDDVDIWRYAIVRVACQKRRRHYLLSPVGIVTSHLTHYVTSETIFIARQHTDARY